MRGLWLAALLLFSAACVETATPRAYKCTPDGGASTEECPGGWICGLEGFCRDPAAEDAWKCDRDSGFGCANGWFCTLEGTCRNRDAGGPFACTRKNADGDPKDGGAPNDCGNPGWWCGHDGVCHQVGVEGPYPCALDSDCEGSFRCSIDGRCIPRPPDALNTSDFPDAGVPELISPLRGAFGATHVAASPTYVSANLSAPDSGVVEADVMVVAYADGGIAGFFRDPASANDFGRIRSTQSSYGISRIEQLGFMECRVYLTRSAGDGGSEFILATVTDPRDGGLPNLNPMQSLSTLGAGAQLRTSNHAGGAVAAFSGDQWSVHDWGLGCGWPYNAQVRPLPGRARDLAWAGYPNIPFLGGTWIASTDKGLFLARESNQDFTQGEWRGLGGAYAPNDRCGPLAPGVTVTHERLKTFGANVLGSLVSVRAGDAGISEGLMVFVVILEGLFPYDNTFPDGGMAFPRVLADGGCTNEAWNLLPTMTEACPPCSAAYPHLVDYSPFVSARPDGGFDVVIDGRCSQAPDAGGGHEIFTLTNERAFAAGNCKRTVVRRTPDFGLVAGLTNTQRVARASRRGGLWEGDTESFAQPLILDDVPDLFIRGADNAEEAIAASNRFTALYQPKFGFVPFITPGGATEFSSHVEGRASWFAAEDGVYSVQTLSPPKGSPIASPPLGGFRQPGMGHGVLLFGRDGGQELLVSSFDTLYSADVSGVADGGLDYGQLELRVIPDPAIAITALAASTPGPNESFFARAYARLDTGVVELRAETRTSWRVQNTGLAGNPLTVFSTGRQARAGYDDGSVFALPSQLRLAPALLPEQRPATSFVSACGQPWVMGRGGLFRLAVDGTAPVGRWERVDLEANVAQSELKVTPADLYERGRLIARGDELWIFLGDGTAFRIPLNCPNGG